MGWPMGGAVRRQDPPWYFSQRAQGVGERLESSCFSPILDGLWAALTADSLQPRGSGGIGRRTSLRGWRPQGREGSSPFFRTKAQRRPKRLAFLCFFASAANELLTAHGTTAFRWPRLRVHAMSDSPQPPASPELPSPPTLRIETVTSVEQFVALVAGPNRPGKPNPWFRGQRDGTWS